jgi:hypothetical protein
MRRLLMLVPAALVAACSAAPVTPTSSPEVAPAAMEVPVPSAIASGQTWWAWPPLSACGPAAEIRYAGKVFWLGNCAGLLFDPATTVSLRVGETLDVHTPADTPVGSAPPELIYPMPSLASSDVLKLVAVGSDRATASYLAVGLGTITLMTRGLCMKGSDQSNGPCPLVTVVVTGS